MKFKDEITQLKLDVEELQNKVRELVILVVGGEEAACQKPMEDADKNDT